MDGLAHYIVEMYSQESEGPSPVDALVHSVSGLVPFSEDNCDMLYLPLARC